MNQLAKTAVVCMSLSLVGCGAARPFTVATPGLTALGQEDAHLYSSVDQSMQALGPATLGERVQNLIDTYEAELQRAEDAQGGFLNTTLSILGFLLPISGTVSAIALSDPDDIQAVSIAAGAATTVTMGLDLLIKPGQKSAAAAECAGFLTSALEAIRLQWDESGLTRLEGTQEQWTRYLAMRGTLEPGRRVACEG